MSHFNERSIHKLYQIHTKDDLTKMPDSKCKWSKTPTNKKPKLTVHKNYSKSFEIMPL